MATHKDDGLAEKNQPAYEYLRARGLAELSDAGEDAYGIAPLDGLPEGCDVWHAKPGRPWGYEIVVPLYSLDGEMVSLQARTTCRAIGDAPRVMTPRGGRGPGIVFASAQDGPKVWGAAGVRGDSPACLPLSLGRAESRPAKISKPSRSKVSLKNVTPGREYPASISTSPARLTACLC